MNQSLARMVSSATRQLNPKYRYRYCGVGGLLGMALLASGQIGLLIVGSFFLSVFSTVAGAHFKVLLSCVWFLC